MPNLDMRAPVLNVEVQQGEMIEIILNLLAGTLPMNLTGCVITGWMGRGARVFPLTITRDDLAGRIVARRIADMPATAYLYDIQVVDSLGRPRKGVRGTIRLTKEARFG